MMSWSWLLCMIVVVDMALWRSVATHDKLGRAMGRIPKEAPKGGAERACKETTMKANEAGVSVNAIAEANEKAKGNLTKDSTDGRTVKVHRGVSKNPPGNATMLATKKVRSEARVRAVAGTTASATERATWRAIRNATGEAIREVTTRSSLGASDGAIDKVTEVTNGRSSKGILEASLERTSKRTFGSVSEADSRRATKGVKNTSDRAVDRGHYTHSHEEESHPDHHHGHSMFDFSSIGIFLALKLKLILLGLAVAALAIIYKTSKPTYGYYPYIDYQYVGYEIPQGAYVGAPYRRPLAAYGHPQAIGPKSLYLSELTSRVWNSIDITGMALGAMGVPVGSCRHRVICQAERAADRSTVMKAALRWLGTSLSKYKSGHIENVGEISCEELYADCPNYNLPIFLEGSSPGQPPGYYDRTRNLSRFGKHPQHVPQETTTKNVLSNIQHPDPRQERVPKSL